VNQELPPADWYPDPEHQGMQRYWDGTQWTEHRAPIAPPAPQERKNTGLIVGGWIGVLLFPLAGLICGIVLLTRGEQGHGLAMTLLSALFIVVAVVAIVAGSTQTATMA
jgi:Protein of unknown function (DUF2510)